MDAGRHVRLGEARRETTSRGLRGGRSPNSPLRLLACSTFDVKCACRKAQLFQTRWIGGCVGFKHITWWLDPLGPFLDCFNAGFSESESTAELWFDKDLRLE